MRSFSLIRIIKMKMNSSKKRSRNRNLQRKTLSKRSKQMMSRMTKTRWSKTFKSLLIKFRKIEIKSNNRFKMRVTAYQALTWRVNLRQP